MLRWALAVVGCLFLLGFLWLQLGGNRPTTQPEVLAQKPTVFPTTSTPDNAAPPVGHIAFGIHSPRDNTILEAAYVVSSDGLSSMVPIQEGWKGLAWSPDGKQFVYETFLDTGDVSEIALVRMDGIHTKRMIGPDSPIYCQDSAWSPDSRHIALTCLGYPDTYGQIIVADITSNKVLRLTGTNRTGDAMDPDWSPDGSRIAFASHHAALWGQIYTVRPDGSGLAPITSFLPEEYPNIPNSPKWSPDGRQLAFYCECGSKSGIFTIGADGTHQKQLVQDGLYFSWSPDGQYIAFTKGLDLYKIRPNGSETTHLVSNVAYHDPVWSPNSRYLTFVSYTEREIYIIDADGTDQRRLTNNDVLEDYLAWLP